MLNTKQVLWIVSVVAALVTTISFLLYEKRRPGENRKSETQIKCITNAINELIEVTRNVGYSDRVSAHGWENTSTILTTNAVSKSKPDQGQIWSATVNVSGAKNIIAFVSSSGNEVVPRVIGGIKNRRVVPIPENYQLNILVAGTKNRIVIDEKLRGRVSIVRHGTDCTIEWGSLDK